MGHLHVNYDNPPLVEVSIGIQFTDLPIRTADVGDFRRLFAEQLDLTDYEEHQPLEPRIEIFEPTPRQFPSIRVETLPPLARQWFASKDGTKLVQLQRDRLIYNWRKTPSDEYPRYPVVEDGFKNSYRCFEAVIRNVLPETQQQIEITQCELAYFNHIESNNVWGKHSEVDKVIQSLDHSALHQHSIEDVRYGFRKRLVSDKGDSIGRVNVNVTPAFRSTDSMPLITIDLTARGKPETPNIADAFSFFDSCHSEIVTLFTDMTTNSMHTVWGKHK